MAFFADASKTNAPFHNDEISLLGNKSGIQDVLIAKQLWNKLSFSGTLSNTQVIDISKKKVLYIMARNYRAFYYSISIWYLLFPENYTHYNQMNLNLHT